MLRLFTSLAASALLLWSCAPASHNACSGQKPNFIAVLSLTGRPLPADTVVHVVYGGSAAEDFRLSDPKARHEVVFCEVADENGVPLGAPPPESMGAAGESGELGAAGAAGELAESTSGVQSLYCKLFTGGFTELTVSGSGFMTTKYELAPKDGLCTVQKPLVPDAPDAG